MRHRSTKPSRTWGGAHAEPRTHRRAGRVVTFSQIYGVASYETSTWHHRCPGATFGTWCFRNRRKRAAGREWRVVGAKAVPTSDGSRRRLVVVTRAINTQRWQSDCRSSSERGSERHIRTHSEAPGSPPPCF